MPPITQDVKDVELAHTGTFNASTGKVKFTRQDFDDMVDAAEALKGKVDFPLKLGHTENQKLLQEDGLPAAGWIENVRREGNTLVADFMKVPEKIADIMKAGGLRKRSLEAMRNVELAGQRFKFVLTGVALLGEELPAVDSLDDIAALYTAASLKWPDIADLEKTASTESTDVFIAAEHDDDEDDDVEDMIREIQRMIGRGDALIRGRKGAPRLRHMLEGAIAEIRRVSKGTKANLGETTDMDKLSREAIVKLLGLDDEVEDEGIAIAIKELQDKNAKAASDLEAALKGEANKGEDDAELADMKKTIDAQGSEILGLKNDKATQEATAAADAAIKASKFAPGVRPNLIKMALGDPKGFEELVTKTPVIAGMTTGVIGSSDDPDTFDYGEYEPSAAILKLATGVTREEHILQAMKDEAEIKGIPVEELVPQKVLASLASKKAD